MLCLWYSELEILCRHFWHTSGNMPSGVAGHGLTEALTKRGKGAVKPKTRFSLAQGDEIQNFNIFQHAGESKLKIRCRPMSEKFHGTTTAAEWASWTCQVSSSLYLGLPLAFFFSLNPKICLFAIRREGLPAGEIPNSGEILRRQENGTAFCIFPFSWETKTQAKLGVLQA